MRNRVSVPLLALVLSSLCAHPPAARAAADTVVLTAEGKVEVAASGATTWSAVRTNQVLQTGDRLRTGLRSRATLRLSDKSVLRVNELTTLKIQPPATANNAPVLDLTSGATYFFSHEKPATLEFRTPLASGAIRGTEFHLAVAENGRTVLSLLEGLVTLKNERGQIDLKTGERGTVEPGQAPARSAVIDAINIIQWCLYYPAVLDPDELQLSPAINQTLAGSLASYRNGDLLQALADYPDNRIPESDSERVYRAELFLAVGQVDQTEAQLKEVQVSTPLADALRELIAAVKLEPWKRAAPPALASEWLAESYYFQSRSQLDAALHAAKSAAAKSPNLGFAWARVAELEFSFGRTPQALAALEKSLQVSPRNAEAISLRGFLLAAQNRVGEALHSFDQAIAVDPALDNAWLGRGLCRIRQGHAEAGRQDLHVAATLEPNRSVLRGYLGKAFSNAGDDTLAAKELALAKRLDPRDPTPWLYSALLDQQQSRINTGVRDLERSQELNDNRRVFRSKLLLDQDRAVRSANLAALYRDAGMTDVSVREASRALNSDYANYSAHLFLAEGYDALRDPKQINLRYETPWLSELLIANLLAPVGGGSLSQYVSQQEYSNLFERDRLGIFSRTDYFSSGNWRQAGSQFGTLGNSSYSLDADYLLDNGWRPNNDIDRLNISARVKEQVTFEDSVYLEAQFQRIEAGDVRQLYDPSSASATLRTKETQVPNVYAGYHHQWSPEAHTLFLAARLNDTLAVNDPSSKILFSRYAAGTVTSVNGEPFSVDYRSELEAYSAELQQLWQTEKHNVVVGGRFQSGWSDTKDTLARPLQTSFDNLHTDLQRLNGYGYYTLKLLAPLELTAGVSYDRLYYPRNIDSPPLTGQQVTREQVSPKGGLIWSPWKYTTFRGAYTRSLGGVFYDNSVRLEPTLVGGFNQAFRSIIPESVEGSVPGSRFEAVDVALDQKFPTETYLGVIGEILYAKVDATIGVFTNIIFIPIPDLPSSTRERLEYRERSLTVYVNQLVGDYLAVGASYKLTQADLNDQLPDIPPTTPGYPGRDVRAFLHQANLFTRFNHGSGFFSQFDAVWTQQSNQRYSPGMPGDDFWQFNAFVGYRFLDRRAEIRVGLLNITDRDYRLNPLTLYLELPRERTLMASAKFYF